MKRVLTAALTALATLVALVAFLPGQSASAAGSVPTTWKSVSARGLTTCAIDSGNGLWCWGYNHYGQVGNGTTADSVSTPVRIGSKQWLSVSTSDYTTCALRLDRSAYCWGDNEFGSTGTGTKGDGAGGTDVLRPKRVDSAVTWAKISASVANGCGISTAGALYCWGSNDNGGVGDGTGADQLSPVRVGAGTTWSGVQVGYAHVCGRTTASTVFCWGNNAEGELGNGTTTNADVPTAVAGSFAQVSTSALTTCGVTTAGVSQCWGYNGDGNVGDGTFTNQTSPTTLASGSKSFSSVLAGFNFSCGVTRSQDKVRCFGDNGSYEFGDGTTTSSTTPTDAAGGLTGWAQVSVGDSTACGLRASGTLFCWGYNNYGELGVGTIDAYAHRVQVGRTPPAGKLG